MVKVADIEESMEIIRKDCKGTVVIPANVNHPNLIWRCREGLSTKVTNIGTSSTSRYENGTFKLEAAIKAGRML